MAQDAPSPDEPDTKLDPYETLGVSDSASEAEIRSAYKKLALKHHPDKVAASERDGAHKAFQDIAFAYAVLSDPKRRERYDRTGNTAESALDDEDFDWADFFRARYSEITVQRLHDFEAEYKRSEEERRDLLKAYEKARGSMSRIYTEVMLSNCLDDEERFQKTIRDAIESGEVRGYDAFLKESDKSRQRRIERARKEAREADAHAAELGLRKKGNKKTQSKPGEEVDVESEASGDAANDDDEEDEDGEPVTQKPSRQERKTAKRKTAQQAKNDEDLRKTESEHGGSGGLSSLAAMISQRQQSRASNFLDGLEAKYAPKSSKGKRKPVDEPPEEAFARTAARKGSKKAKK